MTKGVTDYPMPPLRPEPDRDGWGRYLLPNPENPETITGFTRATTLAKALDDTYNLQQYQKRMVTQGFKVAPHLLDSIDLMQDDSRLRDHLQDVADQAYEEAGGNTASERGTQLHYFTEAVDGGFMTVDQVPEEYRREVQAYLAALAKYGITVPKESVERIIINRKANVAGTADRLPIVMPDGTMMVGDVKSGKDLSYGWLAIAMQLATYADADGMVAYDADGQPYWEGMPVVDQKWGVVFHIPVDQGKCDLYLVDLEIGRAAIDLALEVRETRRRKDIGRPLPFGKFGRPEALPGDVPVQPAPTGDPFAAHPDEAQAWPEAAAQEAHEAAGLEMNPMDEARAWFDKVKALAAEARKARSRRNKAMIRADEQASLTEDGLPSVDVYEKAAAALIEAYGLTVERTADVTVSAKVPEGTTVVLPANTITSVEGTTGEELQGTAPVDTSYADQNATQSGLNSPAPDAEVVPGLTAHQAVGAQMDGETDEAYALRARQGGALKLVEAAPSAEALAALYAEYQDVWTDFHTQRGQARVAELERAAGPTAEPTTPEPTAPQADPHDPMVIKAAIDACTTPEQLGAVWEAHQKVWTDEMTQYGQSVLASK